MANVIIRGRAFEDQAALLQRRVTARDGTGTAVPGEDGFLVLQGDIASIAWTAYALGDLTQTTPLATGTFVVTAVIFNTLQPWTVDNIGYNFSGLIPATVFANMGNEDVRIVVGVTTSGGNFFQLPFDLEVVDITPDATSD